MKRIEFYDSYDLVDKIETLLSDDYDYSLISVYGKYNVIKEILENLIIDGFFILNEIQLEDCDVSNYDKEFVLYVKEDGVNVEKTFIDNKYYSGGGDVSLIHEDCSSSLIKYVESNKIYEFGYSDEDEDESECDDCDCKCCCDCNKEPDDKKINTAVKEKFTVNGKRVDRNAYEKALAEFEDRYLDNIRDMLLRYADFMDNWNEWLKLLY